MDAGRGRGPVPGTSGPREAGRGLEDLVDAGRGGGPGRVRAPGGPEVGLNVPDRRFFECQERTAWWRSGTGVVNPASWWGVLY